MRLKRVYIEWSFQLPVERVFAYLSEHENLKLLFRAPVTRVLSGADARNGVGSCRRIGPLGRLGFEETVSEYIPNELIVYNITKGGPLRDHRGTMRFSAAPDGGSRLEYSIEMGSRLPGAAPLVKLMLERSIPAGLAKVDRLASPPTPRDEPLVGSMAGEITGKSNTKTEDAVMPQKYRVIQWATGNVGQAAIRLMLAHSELELAGVWVHSMEKDGTDAGELCGLGPLGVRASRDVDALLSLEADCVCYAPLEINGANVIDDVCRILASGKNVVTTAATLGAVAVHGPDTVERLNSACDAGGASLYGSGITPDGAESVLAGLMSLCRDIESISRTEIVDSGTYTEPWIFPAMGFGAPEGTPLPEEMMRAYMAPVISLLATIAQVEIEETRHSGKSAVATKSFDTTAFHIEKGTITAMYHRLEGISDGVCRVVADGYYRLGGPEQYPTDWPPFTEPSGYRLTVKGTPEIRADLYVGSPGTTDGMGVVWAAAHRAVNAIPAVCEAPPGIRTALDLPHVTGRLGRLGANSQPTVAGKPPAPLAQHNVIGRGLRLGAGL